MIGDVRLLRKVLATEGDASSDAEMRRVWVNGAG